MIGTKLLAKHSGISLIKNSIIYMSHFAIPVAFKCTEKEFRNSFIKGVQLDKKLEEIGYDLSELKFYPNKEYLVNYYRKVSHLICTTNSPHSNNRIVIDAWNENLFYALCCQKSPDYITVGEFFTTDAGCVHQCTQVMEFYLRYDGYGPAQYPKDRVHKSTAEEIEKEFMQPRSLIVGEITDEQVNSVLHNARKTGIIMFESTNEIFPIRPEELFKAMQDEEVVYYGEYSLSTVRCEPYRIKMMGREDVLVHGVENTFELDRFFFSVKHFLAYASQEIKKLES